MQTSGWVLAGWSCVKLCLEAVWKVSLNFNSQLFFCEVIYFWLNCSAHSVQSRVITGKQIWLQWSSRRLVLLLSWMSLAPDQSCNFIYEMKQVKCRSTEFISVINPDGIPALFTCCCYTKSEAVFAMPLAAFSLQREFGIRSPSSKSTCPTKGMGRGSGWMGKGIIVQQPYFNNLSIDFEVVSCCQVVDAVDWSWLLCIVQYPGIFIHDSNLIFLSLYHAVYFPALLLTLVKFSFILLLSD